MRRIVAALAVLAILTGINLGVDGLGLQIDATQGRIYTLTNATRSVLRGLHDPITLRLFYSHTLGATLPAFGAYADRVTEMLRAYAAAAPGRIRLEIVDPAPFSDAEDQALGYGLQAAPLDQGEQVYFGLAGTNLLDDERVIPFFTPDRGRLLEHDLTQLVYQLGTPTRPVLGVMSSLPLDGDAQTPAATVMTELRRAYDVRTVPLDATAIDPAIHTLLVAQAQSLTPATLYAIDQFVMGGGRLLAMVDPLSEAQATLNEQDTASDLHTLLDAWGIAFDPGQVVADLTGSWQVKANDRSNAVRYVAWFDIRDGINHADPAMADLQQVTVASAGSLAPKPGAAVTFTPLLSTDTQAEQLPVTAVQEPDPAGLLAGFHATGTPFVIAARVRGVLHSAFAGPPPGGAAPPYRAHTDGPTNLVVVADSDILTDRFWVRQHDFFGQPDPQPTSDNGAFVANLLGSLTGNDPLLGLRARGSTLRPFDRMDAIQLAAETRFHQTQQTLQTRLGQVQQRLDSLRQSGGAAVSTQQLLAMNDARTEIVTTRRQLRAVQLDLRRDIEQLEDRLRLFDIALVPALVAAIAILTGLFRRWRRA
jgi:ABC-type uncharacterized transport system involved in gliding motility auxiliary subunit